MGLWQEQSGAKEIACAGRELHPPKPPQLLPTSFAIKHPIEPQHDG